MNNNKSWKTLFLLLYLGVFGLSNHKIWAENIALLGKARSGSVYFNYLPGKVNDRSFDYPAGTWISSDKEKEPQWVCILWDKEYTVCQVKIAGAVYPLYQFKIQMLKKGGNSDKDADWLTKKEVDKNSSMEYTADFGRQDVSVPAAGDPGLFPITKGIRIYVIKATLDSAQGNQYGDYHMVRIAEIEVENDPSQVKPKETQAVTFQSLAPALVEYFQVDSPLFTPLLSNEPGSKKVLLWAGNIDYKNRYRFFAKKFGHRYVWDEQWKEIAAYPFVAIGGVCPESTKYGIPAACGIWSPYGSGPTALKILGNSFWIMDPTWQEAYFLNTLELARKYKGKTDELWAVFTGDEIWEGTAIKVVPKEKRDGYAFFQIADNEIRGKYGFGKYGMPDSDEDPNPFKRIAYRRWVSDKLTETFRRTYRAVKQENSEMKVIGPDFSGAVPAADIEEMSRYFDLIPYQSWNIPSPLTNQLSTGCDTKVMADLSQCPVWALVQNTIGINQRPNIEDIRERYSQPFRNGGQGIVVCTDEWPDFELGHPRYNYPEKWRAMLEITGQVTEMNKVKLPEPDSAILYPSDTLLTLRWAQMTNENHKEIYSAYTVLGPLVRSWFSFVSDRQIDRNTKNLGDYRIFYIPYAKYVRKSVLDKVTSYVKNGGIIVCTDPEAFSWDINGEPLSGQWEKLSGVRLGSVRTGTLSARTVKNDFLVGAEETKFSFYEPGVLLEPVGKDVQNLVLYDDGSPAATVNRYGKGYVIQFASNIFSVSPKLDSPYIKLFRKIQAAANCKVNQDIWRFKLPEFKKVFLPDPEKDRCLTGNNVVFGEGGPDAKHNLLIAGTYTYDYFPTGIADNGREGQEILFSEGNLTNRFPAVKGRGVSVSCRPTELEKWIVSWNDDKPISITFDLKEEFPLSRAKIFYSGILPEFKISGSNDELTWREISRYPAQPVTEDVLDLTLPLDGTYRYLRLEGESRKSGEVLELAEVEIWAKAR